MRITNETGAVTGSFEYDAFGNVVSETMPTEGTRFGKSAPSWIRLTDDPDNNLYVTPTRVYHSGVGRFLQRDPATGFAGGYTYANNAPTNYVDVNGREPEEATGETKYTVKWGDSIWHLCYVKYINRWLDPEDIKQRNGLESYSLTVGQVLIIPKAQASKLSKTQRGAAGPWAAIAIKNVDRHRKEDLIIWDEMRAYVWKRWKHQNEWERIDYFEYEMLRVYYLQKGYKIQQELGQDYSLEARMVQVILRDDLHETQEFLNQDEKDQIEAAEKCKRQINAVNQFLERYPDGEAPEAGFVREAFDPVQSQKMAIYFADLQYLMEVLDRPREAAIAEGLRVGYELEATSKALIVGGIAKSAVKGAKSFATKEVFRQGAKKLITKQALLNLQMVLKEKLARISQSLIAKKLSLEGVKKGLVKARRFFYDPRKYKTISKEYWKLSGKADGRSLHHWLIPQRASFVPQGLRNAGFNLMELPSFRGVFHPTLGLNQWMGFARNWGPAAARNAKIVEGAIRFSVPAAGGATGYGGYKLGEYIVESGEGE